MFRSHFHVQATLHLRVLICCMKGALFCLLVARNAADNGDGFLVLENNIAALCNVGVMSW